MNKPLDLSYQKKNGLLYPKLQISKNAEADTVPLGKYGQMCLVYLKDKYTERYAELRMNGDLMPIMHKVDDEAHKRVKEFTQQLIESEKYAKTNDTMQNFKQINTCKAVAEEMVLNEFVYQPK